MRVTLKQLAVFDAVARAGSVSLAAQEVALTQSAASMSLQELENSLGVELFHRHRRKLTLNENGRRLHPKARSILSQVGDLETAATTGTLQGSLRVGAGSSIGNYMIPEVCADFVALHPSARIDLRVMPSTQIMNAIEGLTLDVGFVEGPQNRPKLDTMAWAKDRLVIVAAADAPIAKRKKLKIDDLKGQTWFLQNTESSARVSMSTVLFMHTESMTIGLESSSIEAIKRAVATGKGIGCLSRRAVEPELASGILVELDVRDFDLTRPYSVVTRKQAYKSELQVAFIRHAMQYAERDLPK